MTAREKLLEQKVHALEQRLALVERFVELRFCETFRDFTIRNGKGIVQGPSEPDDDDEEGDNGRVDDPSTEHRRKSTTRPIRRGTTAARFTGAGRSNKPGPASSKRVASTGKQAGLKNCVVRIVKTADVSVNSQQTEASSVVTGSSSTACPRYGTRRQTRLSEANVKREVDDQEHNLSHSEQVDMNLGDASIENTIADDSFQESYADDYFTYPEDTSDYVDTANEKNTGKCDNYDPDPVGLENDYQNDREWSGGDENDDENDDDDDDDYVSSKPSETRGTKRKKRGPYDKKRTGSRKKSNIYYLTSIKDLSDDTKIVSTDPTRGECPICKQHWKLEVLEQHISSHAKERHIQCPHCDKRYFKMDDLRCHIRILHDREKHFPKCRICGVAVVRKMILHEKFCVKRSIMRGETVDASLVESIRQECAKEGLEFVLPEDTVPPGVDPYERVACPRCKKFFKRYILDRHVKSHTMARNWKCSKCPKSYIHKHDLIRHVVVTHETLLQCNHCDVSFETRTELANHKIKCRQTKGLGARPKTNLSEPRTADVLSSNNDEVAEEPNQPTCADEEVEVNTTSSHHVSEESEPIVMT